MKQQVLAPGMQYREEADVGSKMFGVAGDGEQGLGAGVEEYVVNDLLILEGKFGDAWWQSKYDVIVSGGQQFGLAPRKPLLAGQGLALGAVAVAAGVIADALMGAVAASFDMTAEGGGAASLDGAHGLELFEA